MKQAYQIRLLRDMTSWRGLWGICVAVALNLAADYARAAALDSPDTPFRTFAQDLLTGIGSASVADIPALGGYGKPRIAVAPFRKKDKAIAPDVASEFNARLLAELTRQGRRTYRFFARETLKEIIHEIDGIGELEERRDNRVGDLLRNARVDILIVGKLRKSGNSIILSYKALSVEDGIVFAATRPRRVGFTPPRATVTKKLRQVPRGSLAKNGRRTVLHAQRLLFVLGYDPGSIDGRMRPPLRRAIRAYQRDLGQIATGRMTRSLIRHLRANVREGGKTALALP